jgi:hypothetical protein
MQNIFNEKTYKSIRQRIESLQPDAIRQFGIMDMAQMLAHCNSQLDIATGILKLQDESTFFRRNIIRRVLPYFNTIPKGTETSESLKVKDARQFAVEKQKLLGTLDTIYKRGVKAEWYPHPAFGKMSGREWAHLIPLHLDHHLRQFSN